MLNQVAGQLGVQRIDRDLPQKGEAGVLLRRLPADPAAQVVQLVQLVQIDGGGADADGFGVVVALVHDIEDKTGGNGEYFDIRITVGVHQTGDGILHPIDLRAALHQMAAHFTEKIQKMLGSFDFHEKYHLLISEDSLYNHYMSA